MALKLSDLATAARAGAAPSWLWKVDADGLPLTRKSADELLAHLTLWAGRVYVRYPHGQLPECWLWHPDVVEELVCLWWLWHEAYLGKAASAQRAGDWHDRQRPGVVRRIAAAAGECSLRDHLEAPSPPTVPAEDAAASIAVWWATDAASPPFPTTQQIHDADVLHGSAAAGRRWPS